MPNVPLPTGFQSIDEYPRLKENLLNMMNSGGNKLMQRPGIVGKATSIANCRGQIKFKDELYQVSGQKLIKILEDNTIVEIGDVFSDQQCALAVGFTHLVIVVKGDRGYSWDGQTFQEITDDNFVSSIDVTYMNGRYIYIPFNGDPAFFSEPFDPNTIDPLAFFDAETQPDKNTGVLNFKNRLYIMGEETFEVFRDTGTGSVPYKRIDGASIWTGLVAGHTLYANSFAFLGKDKDNNYGIFVMGSGNASRISNPAVDEFLNNEYTDAELKTCIAQRLQWKGEDIAIFRFPRHTLNFNGVGWFFSSSIATFEEKQFSGNDFKTWRANYITHCYGEYYVGDVQTDDIGILDDIASDYGDDIESGFDTFMRFQRGSYFSVKLLEIDGIAGQTSPQQTIGLSISEDGKSYGPIFYIGLGEVGEYLKRVSWELPGGLGDYESFMGIRIRTTAPIEIATEGLNVVI